MGGKQTLNCFFSGIAKEMKNKKVCQSVRLFFAMNKSLEKTKRFARELTSCLKESEAMV
jgi:hypothetical protein